MQRQAVVVKASLDKKNEHLYVSVVYTCRRANC
jgi:hypothetical protein